MATVAPTQVVATSRRLELLLFAVGVSTLGGEIAAARLMAPFFGASTIVWANTIATVLVALSAGYWLGGRVADRWPTQAALDRWVTAAAVLLAVVPVVARPFLGFSVQALDEVEAGPFVGSLLGVLALIALPMLVLGAVAPWAIRLRVHRAQDAGSVAGRLYAISTLGSLLGTFLAALLLIPVLGTQRTFGAFALLLAVVSTVGLPRRFLLVPAVLAAALALPTQTTKAEGGLRLLAEKETAQQYARVVEKRDGERRLELNEGQAFHSVWRADSVLTGNVWDGYLALPFSVLGRAPERLAILGNGAGTTVRAYGQYFPRTRIDAVEIDGELTTLGKRWFGLRERPGLRLITDDARPFLRRTPTTYDAIFVDAYRQPYVPFYLATEEFFGLVRERLSPGGVVVINVGHPEDSDALEDVLVSGVGSAFDHVAAHAITRTNTLLVGSDVQPAPAALRAAAPALPAELRPVFGQAAAQLRPAAPRVRAFTDDRAPVEWLIDKSILEVAAG